MANHRAPTSKERYIGPVASRVALAVFLSTLLSAVTSSAQEAGVRSPSDAASLQWLYQAETCEQLSDGITAHFASAASKPVDAYSRAQLRIVLFEGCGPRFADCKLSVCEQATRLEAAELRPLTWLNDVSTCAQFKSEFKKRYSFLRSFDGQEPELQTELDYVFYRACAENFADCSFSQCAPSSSVAAANSNRATRAGSDPSHLDPTRPASSVQEENGAEVEGGEGGETAVPLSEAELAQLARVRAYDRSVAEELLQRAATIEIKLAIEKEQNLQWLTAANPRELETLRQRREQETVERQQPLSNSGRNATQARPPRATPTYRGNAPLPQRPVPQRPVPVKPRIQVEGDGPLLY